MTPNLMPVAFIGHGSPMNAVADNAYTRMLSGLARRWPRPRAVLCISAHWMTDGTWVTHMARPRTIHDFGSFPQELFDIQYPAPGDPALAEDIKALFNAQGLSLDDTAWGLDHGTWSVLRHIYPAADVPVVQLSLDMQRSAADHFALGTLLRPLREQGVLILGSGNIVHNLRRIVWQEDAPPYDWATEFDERVRDALNVRDDRTLVDDALITEAGRLSIPTPDHWYPFLYVLGAALPGEKTETLFEGMQNASISMRSVAFGLASEPQVA